jgi:NAD(P)H-dependent FMN reductase
MLKSQFMKNIKIKVILASTREGRLGDTVARWVMDVAKNIENAEFELLDLKDYSLPFLNHPSLVEGSPEFEVHSAWKSKINEADAFVVVTPEYNHGYPAELKNAIDHLKLEWARKAIAFVGYGGAAGGARSVEQLRQVFCELQVAPIREQIVIPMVWEKLDEQGDLKDRSVDENLTFVFAQLLWWARTLQYGRENIA